MSSDLMLERFDETPLRTVVDAQPVDSGREQCARRCNAMYTRHRLAELPRPVDGAAENERWSLQLRNKLLQPHHIGPAFRHRMGFRSHRAKVGLDECAAIVCAKLVRDATDRRSWSAESGLHIGTRSASSSHRAVHTLCRLALASSTLASPESKLSALILALGRRKGQGNRKREKQGVTGGATPLRVKLRL